MGAKGVAVVTMTMLVVAVVVIQVIVVVMGEAGLMVVGIIIINEGNRSFHKKSAEVKG